MLLDVTLSDLLTSAGILTTLGRDFFRSWLEHHGIDPDTGKMTLDGLAFFEEVVAQQNARNRVKRERHL